MRRSWSKVKASTANRRPPNRMMGVIKLASWLFGGSFLYFLALAILFTIGDL
jgi:hypothetical protein